MENLAIAAEAARVEAKTFTTTGPNGEQLVVQAQVTVCPVGYPKFAETWDGFDPHAEGYCMPLVWEASARRQEETPHYLWRG